MLSTAGRLFKIVTTGLLAAQLAFAPVSTAHAQRGGIPVVRDAEIEALVREYAGPVLQAAGLSRSGIEIILVNSNSFNAFVAGRRIFIHTGALLASETPNEIIGVIAHEAGHIAGGHQQRLRQQLETAQTMAIVAGLLGIGAAIGGAASGAGGLAQGGMGLAMGGSEMARRGLLAYQRSEEATADRSAITYLEQTGQSARGMVKTFERMASTLSLTGAQIDPYQISHPLPRERIQNVQELAQASRFYSREDPAALQRRHDMMRAKIAAYTQGQSATSRLFRDTTGMPARYGDAIVTHLTGSPAAALQKVDALIASEPNNPYFHELRGEVLIRGNRPQDAVTAFQRAGRLDPNNSGFMQFGLGQALLAAGGPEAPMKAVDALTQGLSRAPEYVSAYRYLAQAYGQMGEIAEAELATAEGHYYAGNFREARQFAARAQSRLQPGSPSYVRAQDIINQRPQD